MICVDSSVAVKWILQEDRTEQAQALLAATLAAREAIVAPPLLTIEITNILRQRMRRTAQFTLERVLRLLDDFEGFPVDIHNPPGLHRRALVLAAELDLAAAYDAHYLALAAMFDCTIWTDDQRLFAAAAQQPFRIRLISDYGVS